MMIKTILTLLLACLFCYSPLSFAEEPLDEEAEAKENKEPLRYFPITPNTLTFYQNTGKKLGYIVVQVQVVVRGDDSIELLEKHLPLLQDALIDFFNRQDKKVIEDLTQRESLRQQAKVRLAETIKEETGQDIVENVLFTQYIFQ